MDGEKEMRKITWSLCIVTVGLASQTHLLCLSVTNTPYTHIGKGWHSTQEQGTGEVIIYSHKQETSDKIRFGQIV